MFCVPRAVHVCCLLLFSATLSSRAGGQEVRRPSRVNQAVRGHLLDLEAVMPVSTGAITLISGGERLAATGTDEEGYFFLPIPNPGEYQLEARRLGYATTRSQAFQVMAGDTLTVRFGVRPDAVLLEPLLVVGRTGRGLSRFSDHMEEWGEGIFLTPEMIDSIAPRHYGDIFRNQEDIWLSWGWGTLSTGTQGPVPRARTYRGRGCMTYMVNRTPVGSGNRYILEGIDPETIEAVEIYRYPGEVPPDLRNFGDMTVASSRSGAFGSATYSILDFYECGVVVYWTTEGW